MSNPTSATLLLVIEVDIKNLSTVLPPLASCYTVAIHALPALERLLLHIIHMIMQSHPPLIIPRVTSQLMCSLRMYHTLAIRIRSLIVLQDIPKGPMASSQVLTRSEDISHRTLLILIPIHMGTNKQLKCRNPLPQCMGCQLHTSIILHRQPNILLALPPIILARMMKSPMSHIIGAGPQTLVDSHPIMGMVYVADPLRPRIIIPIGREILIMKSLALHIGPPPLLLAHRVHEGLVALRLPAHAVLVQLHLRKRERLDMINHTLGRHCLRQGAQKITCCPRVVVEHLHRIKSK